MELSCDKERWICSGGRCEERVTRESTYIHLNGMVFALCDIGHHAKDAKLRADLDNLLKAAMRCIEKMNIPRKASDSTPSVSCSTGRAGFGSKRNPCPKPAGSSFYLSSTPLVNSQTKKIHFCSLECFMTGLQSFDANHCKATAKDDRKSDHAYDKKEGKGKEEEEEE